MSIPVHDVGDRRKLTCTVYDEDDVLTTPTSLIFTMLEPDGMVTEYILGTDEELVEDSEGVFHVYWDTAQAGTHRWRFEAGGTIRAVEESSFLCRESQVIIPS